MKEAGVMLIVRDGLILGITRRHDKTKFGLIGGKFDDKAGDKTVKDTAIRETFEETGIKVKEAVFVYQREEKADKPGGQDFYSSCYYATDWENEPHDSEEGSVKWLSPDEVTGPATAAFGDYNKKTLEIFQVAFPDVPLWMTEKELREKFSHIPSHHLDMMVRNHQTHLDEYRERLETERRIKQLSTYENDDVAHHPWAHHCSRCGRWEVAEGEMEMYGPYWYCPVCDKRSF